MFDSFAVKRVPGLFYKADNLKTVAGHFRILGSKPGRGLKVYQYNQILPHFALHRVWSCWFVALHHVGPGLSCDPPGWHWRFAKFSIQKNGSQLIITLRGADDYATTKR